MVSGTGRWASIARNSFRRQELKGISRVSLAPGETKTITIRLNTRSFAYYDGAASNGADKGTYQMLVGSSSADIALRET